MTMRLPTSKKSFSAFKKEIKGRSGMYKIGAMQGILGATNDIKIRKLASKELKRLGRYYKMR